MTRRAILILIIIGICIAVGCSKSSTTQASFGSSSDSSSSPFKSSSKSSSGDDEDDKKKDDDDKEAEETAFQRDVRNYTVKFARSADPSDVESFQRGLGPIAEEYGISDWERTQDAFVAIGRGLGESELDDENAKDLAVALANDDYDHLMLIRKGLESERAQ